MKFLLLLLLPAFCFSQTNIYTNLALEGGGIRGIAYAGAFKVLEEKGVLQQVNNVAGSSAGAIAGMMVAIGYRPNEIDSMLRSLSFKKFNDGGGGIIGKYFRIRKSTAFIKAYVMKNG